MGNSKKSLLMPVKARPYLHQTQAFDFACEKFGLTAPYPASNGVALLMEMGTGKTITSIGITGQMHGILYVDESGRGLSPLYTWQDRICAGVSFSFFAQAFFTSASV